MYPYPQGVLKVRKRVTLMVITVSTIFGISWGTSSITYVLKHFTTRNTGHVAISTTMALLNSAVNPFLYALFNQQFRGKVKRMLCLTFCSPSRIQDAGEIESIEFRNRIINTTMQPTEAWRNKMGPRSLKNDRDLQSLAISSSQTINVVKKLKRTGHGVQVNWAFQHCLRKESHIPTTSGINHIYSVYLPFWSSRPFRVPPWGPVLCTNWTIRLEAKEQINSSYC